MNWLGAIYLHISMGERGLLHTSLPLTRSLKLPKENYPLCNGLIGKWNIEDDGNCMDGCPRLRSVDENKWMGERFDNQELYIEKEDHKVK